VLLLKREGNRGTEPSVLVLKREVDNRAEPSVLVLKREVNNRAEPSVLVLKRDGNSGTEPSVLPLKREGGAGAGFSDAVLSGLGWVLLNITLCQSRAVRATTFSVIGKYSVRSSVIFSAPVGIISLSVRWSVILGARVGYHACPGR
jgi:hypothetical protein